VENDGHITDAVSSQEWPGEANVHVSIVDWVKEPATLPTQFRLDGSDVPGITTSLRPGQGDDRGETLVGNEHRQFFGVVQSGDGFILNDAEAAALLADAGADYSVVVKPLLVGNDITKSPALAPRRWIINFGEMPLEEAMLWPAALAIVRERVKPSRDHHTKAREREQWWKFSRTVRDLFETVAPLRRFIACPATGKRFPMVWCEPNWTPSNAVSVFAFEDDYAMGVLSSSLHLNWARSQSTTLETRPRYTVPSFATFPWPTVDEAGRNAVGRATQDLIALRVDICAEREIGLTRLYNEIDDGAWLDLAGMQRHLDAMPTDGHSTSYKTLRRRTGGSWH